MSNELRVKMKVWTDPDTGKRFLTPAGYTSIAGGPIKVYAMSEEETKLVSMSTEEWNKLPFFYFKEDGECLVRTSRPGELLSFGKQN